jgi:hypothetical protein
MLAAILHGFRRAWNVAVPAVNPGGFLYSDVDGKPVNGTVSYLGIRHAHDRAAMNGVVIALDEDGLSALDRRERNYRRIEVTEHVEADIPKGRPVYTYLPLPRATHLNDASRAAGTDHLWRRYVETVLDAFDSLGDEQLVTYHATTDPTDSPVVEAVRTRLAPRPKP